MVKLWTEVLVANRLKGYLSVNSIHETHGKIHGDRRPIAGGTQRHFTAKDPDFLPNGSEGSIIFGAGQRTFKISFCCSYGKGLNYARIDYANLAFDVTLRFANAMPPLDGKDYMTWGSPAVPPNGHPLGIMVIVNPRLAPEISVLTYNTHLFAGSTAALPKPQIKAFDKARADELMERVFKLKPDIVCLQEVWALDEQNQMIKGLSGQYAYAYVAPEATLKPLLPAWTGFIPLVGLLDLGIQAIRNALAGTSGLVVFSKHQMEEPEFVMYDNLDARKVPSISAVLNPGDLSQLKEFVIGDDDGLAKKGVIKFKVTLLAGDGDQMTHFNIASTHCPTDVHTATDRIRTVAAPLVFGKAGQDGIDALLLGDFNIHKQSEEEARALTKVMDSFNAKDLFVEFNNTDIDKTYTDWPADNSLKYVLEKQDGKTVPTGKQDRLDYMYFKQSKKNPMITPIGIEVLHDWEVPGIIVKEFEREFPLTVSDHYPVFARFRVTKAVEGNTQTP